MVNHPDDFVFSQAAATKAIADDAQRDLDLALPALESAVACLNSLKKSDIDEVRRCRDAETVQMLKVNSSGWDTSIGEETRRGIKRQRSTNTGDRSKYLRRTEKPIPVNLSIFCNNIWSPVNNSIIVSWTLLSSKTRELSECNNRHMAVCTYRPPPSVARRTCILHRTSPGYCVFPTHFSSDVIELRANRSKTSKRLRTDSDENKPHCGLVNITLLIIIRTILR